MLRHEELIEKLAHESGFDEISVSSRVAPLVKIVARGDTTVMDAYLNPILRDYVGLLRSALPSADLRIMTSAGGLVAAEQFVGKDSILSGPAGGVVGFSRAEQAAGFAQAIGFDMGGTSTDVSRFDGRFELEYETEKAGVRVVAPMMAIETVAAGGGSICAVRSRKIRPLPRRHPRPLHRPLRRIRRRRGGLRCAGWGVRRSGRRCRSNVRRAEDCDAEGAAVFRRAA